MVGMFFGGLVLGKLCDAFGRKFGTALSVLTGTFAHYGAGWSQNFYTYCVSRFAAGIGISY